MPKTYACSICNQAFPKFADCKTHEAMHSPENAYFCTWGGCNFVTLHKASFHYHTDVHTGEQRFICPHDDCNYRTHTSSNLTASQERTRSSQPPPPAEPLPLGTFHQYQYQLQPMQPQPMQSYPTQYQPQSTQYQPPPPIHNQSLEVLYGPAGTAHDYTMYTEPARAPNGWTEGCIGNSRVQTSLTST
ncbi:hypothetical protein EV424DRAFT_1351648 [Suillus variegatus]|nr:hypothetical protein EV424DRAFT_1351648 [Suillus variegatus]